MSLFAKSTLSSYWVRDYRRTFKERPQKNIQFSRITFCPAASELRLSDQTGDQSTDSWMLSCHSSGVQKTKNYPAAPVSTADENAQCRSKTYLHPKQGQKQERWGMWISIIKQTSDQMKKSEQTVQCLWLSVSLSLTLPQIEIGLLTNTTTTTRWALIVIIPNFIQLVWIFPCK